MSDAVQRAPGRTAARLAGGRASRIGWAVATAISWGIAAYIAIDTLRTVLPLTSSLPWFDDWATVALFGAWRSGSRALLDVLLAQHNEHRILFPRLVFFTDDLWFGGQERIGIWAIFGVQALHAALFTAVVVRARPSRAGRWAIGGVVAAMMFSLRQGENFSTEFQLAFVGVFAAASLSFVSFGRAMARAAERPSAAGLAAAAIATFTLANGLVAPCVLVMLALASRRGARVVMSYAAAVVLLAVVYLDGYHLVAGHDDPVGALRHPLGLLAYVATYLGAILPMDQTGPAGVLGAFGILLSIAATVRVVRQRPAHPDAVALWGVMLFVSASAVMTATGRLGIEWPMAGRYATGSVAFWSAQLGYWWIDPPGSAGRAAAGMARAPGPEPVVRGARAAVALLGLLLLFLVVREQDPAKPPLYRKAVAQNDAANLLRLGLDDRAVIERTAWIAADVRPLFAVLKDRRLSIFGDREAAALGRPVTERGTVTGTAECSGRVSSALADPTLGADGVRIFGQAVETHRGRVVRRVLLADRDGKLVGFASGGDPDGGPHDWKGFAVARTGEVLTAYAVLDGDRLCGVGSAVVAPPAGSSAG